MYEIERKFLVLNNDYLQEADKIISIQQKYIIRSADSILRVRCQGDKAFITVKKSISSIRRYEFEYEIPFNEALKMMQAYPKVPTITKDRYIIRAENGCWEVDRFLDDNAGLVLAEKELASEDEQIDFPSWLGEEVTEDKRYSNSNLSENPYRKWNQKTEKMKK